MTIAEREGLDAESDGSDADGRALAAGGAALGIAMLIANAGNYLLNVVLGRWLTPAEFADANLMVTIMLLVTALAISLQLVAARFAGINAVNGRSAATAALSRRLVTMARLAGGALAIGLIAGAPWWSDFFNSASALPFAVLGIGMPFYLAQAVGRGVLQGLLRFRPLALTFVVEMLVRVALGIGLVAAGLGVLGATIGLTASFVATWAHVQLLVGRLRSEGELAIEPGIVPTMSVEDRRALTAYAGPVGLLLLGQIMINNGDVLVAKRFLDPEAAGVYAAVALVGRAVFFLSWSVATTLFPAAAQRQERGEQTDGLLYGGLAIVALMGVGFVGGAYVLGDLVLGRVFGPEFGDVSGPLALYALATSMFAMANLIVSHHLSMGRIREALVLLAGAAFQSLLLVLGRGSTDELITMQVIAMAVLLASVVGSHLTHSATQSVRTGQEVPT